MWVDGHIVAYKENLGRLQRIIGSKVELNMEKKKND